MVLRYNRHIVVNMTKTHCTEIAQTSVSTIRGCEIGMVNKYRGTVMAEENEFYAASTLPFTIRDKKLM